MSLPSQDTRRPVAVPTPKVQMISPYIVSSDASRFLRHRRRPSFPHVKFPLKTTKTKRSSSLSVGVSSSRAEQQVGNALVPLAESQCECLLCAKGARVPRGSARSSGALAALSVSKLIKFPQFDVIVQVESISLRFNSGLVDRNLFKLKMALKLCLGRDELSGL